ncbi:MAG TPA: HAMP domain-containing sensor histidine kinase [Baekduia sp.]|nr:HAMP domain-containing sensor histidine kinase [Baekduia sp.]
MRRRLPLGGWLALGFALAVAAPAVSAGATWWAVGAHQRADANRRLSAAEEAIEQAGKRVQLPATQRLLRRRLAALHVEADVGVPIMVDGGTPAGTVRVPQGIGDPETAKAAKDAKTGLMTLPVAKGSGELMTDGLVAVMRDGDPKQTLAARYRARGLSGKPVAGTLFVERPSAAVRVAATAIVGLMALALALVVGVVLLRRWVVAPLARLAADAERIAGGELDVSPVSSRTREVAEVGAALHGMADGLRGALAERESAEHQRRFLVSAIAHDLRTPLFTLRGSLEAIEHGIGDGDQLRRAQDKATLLDRLVGDLFTFSRLEYAGPELERETLDVARLAHEAADTVDPGIVVVAPDEAIALEGDHAVLVRVLVNLLDNAVRHARSRVELHVSASEAEVRLEVLDDGRGIDPADRPHLFEPLFRADRTRNSATGGAGLGLAIVERLTTAHGGTVEAGNRREGGARFVVRYPRAAARPDAPQPGLSRAPGTRSPAPR